VRYDGFTQKPVVCLEDALPHLVARSLEQFSRTNEIGEENGYSSGARHAGEILALWELMASGDPQLAWLMLKKSYLKSLT
jgi:hypothetical protein